MQWEAHRERVHRQARDQAPIASRQVHSRVTFPVVRHSTAGKIDRAIKRPLMEVQLVVAWLVLTLRGWDPLHALLFSPSCHRVSPNGESFLFLSFVLFKSLSTMNRMLIIYIRSYKLVITLFKQSYDEFESYLAKEKNEFHIRNSLRFIIQSCVVFFLISFHIFINNLSLILYDLA